MQNKEQDLEKRLTESKENEDALRLEKEAMDQQLTAVTCLS